VTWRNRDEVPVMTLSCHNIYCHGNVFNEPFSNGCSGSTILAFSHHVTLHSKVCALYMVHILSNAQYIVKGE
jgi:hypothetical protein